jgi:ABC-type multidrug transport system fused ATPase/permease subunit
MVSASNLKEVHAIQPSSPHHSQKDDIVSLNAATAATADGDTKKTNTDVLASSGDVFSFVRNKTMVFHLVIGLFFSIVSGGIMPAMSWIFSSSFTNFAADPGSDQFLADIRRLAYTFMALGVIALISMTLQATFMEMFASEMATVMKEEWFAALMRQDMAYYGKCVPPKG